MLIAPLNIFKINLLTFYAIRRLISTTNIIRSFFQYGLCSLEFPSFLFNFVKKIFVKNRDIKFNLFEIPKTNLLYILIDQSYVREW